MIEVSTPKHATGTAYHPWHLAETEKEPEMHELIKINTSKIGNQEVNAVSGRDLHAFLEVGKTFAAWMPEQIEAFGFEEGKDYEIQEGLSVPDSESAKAAE